MRTDRLLTRRDVDRELRKLVWPLLTKAGFAERSGRTGWRRREDFVEVINFQSFNRSLADRVGTTTVSFAINLGIQPLCSLPARVPEKDGQPCPREYHCDLRHNVQKAIEQPEYPRPDIWFVRADGSNLADVVADARRAITVDALPWFESFAGLADILPHAPVRKA